jgi:Family of unknown function (DUF6326)
MASKKILENVRVPTRIKLSLLWASLMSLYIYNDYFLLFVPGTIDGMAAGSMGPLGDYTESKMIVVALILAIPASMVYLSSILSAVFSRRLNLVFGAIYVVMAVLTLIGSPPFYKVIVCFQIVAILLILWLATRWPNQVASP